MDCLENDISLVLVVRTMGIRTHRKSYRDIVPFKVLNPNCQKTCQPFCKESGLSDNRGLR